MKKLIYSIAPLFSLLSFAQKDSISVHISFSENRKIATVKQHIVFQNQNENPILELQLLNWVSAYKNRNTTLAKRLLEDRNRELYFAKSHQLGNLKQLSFSENGIQGNFQGNLKDEQIEIPLSKPLNKGESTKIELQYQLQIPDKMFTGYGRGEGTSLLKYFFLVPKRFQQKNYQNIEETENYGSYWDIQMDVPKGFYTASNLKKTEEHHFQGWLKTDPELFLSENPVETFSTQLGNQTVNLQFEYIVSPEERSRMEFYIPLHLKFLQDKLGTLPETLFISEKFKNDNDFIGIKDIKFWKFHYQLFSDNEKTDLNYFSILSNRIIEDLYAADKENNHWLKNGIQNYLEQQYLYRFYSQSKLLGQLPEKAKILGLKPLKLFHVSRLQLLDRYGLAYQYMMTQNLDQKIGEPFSEFSNFNRTVISKFETGTLLRHISQTMGENRFDLFLKNYLQNHSESLLDSKDFLSELSNASSGSSGFFERFIEHKNRMNFKLKNFKRDENKNELHLKISKNTTASIPVNIETLDQNGNSKNYWLKTSDEAKSEVLTIPDFGTYKLSLNDHYSFPEANFRDNYLYTKGFFSNMKKTKIKFFKDIPNPEYNEIYVNPRFDFNVYDKMLLGINFKNSSFFDRKFNYSLSPYYSTGTRSMAGSGEVSYSFMPSEKFYRKLNIGVSGSYFHFDYNLAYTKLVAFANMYFRKGARSTISRSVGFSYNYFERDLSPKMIAKNDYGKYNLWTLRYNYSDNRMIHEKYLNFGSQWMDDFSKISAEGFYRWEYDKNKKISFRAFAGYFIENKTKNDMFDYGLSKVSNYTFSYGLLGQSASTGFLSQQFILSDGGFKSGFKDTVNRWLVSANVDANIWKIFNVYADAGVYKNHSKPAEFIWDSGVKVRIIPDFIEVYFPVQSSLGFEPSFKDYASRIRYTLVFDLGAVIENLRRGLF